MIKITGNGELEVYPTKARHQLPLQLYSLLVLPLIGVAGYICHVMFGSVVALLLVILIGISVFCWRRFLSVPTTQRLSSGVYRVRAGQVSHVVGSTVLNSFVHDGRDAVIDEVQEQVTLTLLNASKSPQVVFMGFESRKEADAMLACLRGQKIAVRNANIRMQSS